jgi:hypothetical protein
VAGTQAGAGQTLGQYSSASGLYSESGPETRTRQCCGSASLMRDIAGPDADPDSTYHPDADPDAEPD